ncbi:hypothetical protein [Sandarakinorhabdus glacialis]|uniref:hypothetical protein n=1 Tax=Sandarakinorhabdus glacialis TaxID=1614636 RepID=UPI001FB07B1E|nr:hypothetical protein [Polymorphobacter glacialis]
MRPVYDAAATGEGPIPGLPGPATLRVSRPEPVDVAAERPVRAPRAERAPRREAPVVEAVVPETTLFEAAAVEPDAGEAAAPRRRGRPRKVAVDASTEG